MSLNHKKALRLKRDEARRALIPGSHDDIRQKNVALGGLNNETITYQNETCVIIKDDRNTPVAHCYMLNKTPIVSGIQGKPYFQADKDKNMGEYLKKALININHFIGNKDFAPIVFESHPKMDGQYSTLFAAAVEAHNKRYYFQNSFR